MEIPVSCTCGKSFKAKSTLAGKTVACPGCKSPISIPAASGPATTQTGSPPTAPPPPAAPAGAANSEILMACGCGQQFKVDSRFAGQQVNCPACQSLCVIPDAQQPPSAFSAAVVQQPPPAPQPMMQQPMMQQPMMQQPIAPQQPMLPQQQAYSPAGGMGMDYQQPSYGGGHQRMVYRTGVGIFIFAIATCVFAGGYGMYTINNLIRMIGNWSGSYPHSLYDLITVFYRLGSIAQFLSIIAIVVASVFMMLSPAPLFGLGIAMIATSGTASIFYLLADVLPRLGIGNSLAFGGGMSMVIFQLITVNGTFILCSVFMHYAIQMKRTRVAPSSPIAALYGFSTTTILTIAVLLIDSGAIESVGLRGTRISGQALKIFADFLTIVSFAAMIVGLVFLIISLFQSRSAYRS